MAITFKTENLQLTKQLLRASGGNNMLYINGVEVTAGVSGNLIQTGIQLINIIANTGQQVWNAANNNGINLSGNLTATGQTLFNRDVTISGALETKISATGNAAINYATSVGQIISGNLTQTGIILNNKIDNISGMMYPNSNPSGYINKYNEFFYSETTLNVATQFGSFSGINLPYTTGDLLYLRYDKINLTGASAIGDNARNYRPYVALTGLGIANGDNSVKFVLPQTGRDITLYKARLATFTTDGRKTFTFAPLNTRNPVISGAKSVIIRPHTTSSRLRFDLNINSGVAGICTGIMQWPKYYKMVQNVDADIYVSFQKDNFNPTKSIDFYNTNMFTTMTNKLLSVTGYGIECTEKITLTYINSGENQGSWIC